MTATPETHPTFLGMPPFPDAAKEALAKALGAPVGLHWQDAEVVSESSGRPFLEMRGSVLDRARELGVASVHVSLSHDAGIASAVVVLEG